MTAERDPTPQDAHHGIAAKDKYNGLVDCFKRIYVEQGFLSYWRGNVVNVVRYFPTQVRLRSCSPPARLPGMTSNHPGAQLLLCAEVQGDLHGHR
jgi:hypothetical protein